MVFGAKNDIIKEDAISVMDSIIRFLSSKNAINFNVFGAHCSVVIDKETIEVIKAKCAGIFKPNITPSSRIKKGEVLGIIYDSLNGEIKERIIAPTDGIVTCIYNYPLIFEHTVAFRIARFESI